MFEQFADSSIIRGRRASISAQQLEQIYGPQSSIKLKDAQNLLEMKTTESGFAAIVKSNGAIVDILQRSQGITTVDAEFKNIKLDGSNGDVLMGALVPANYSVVLRNIQIVSSKGTDKNFGAYRLEWNMCGKGSAARNFVQLFPGRTNSFAWEGWQSCPANTTLRLVQDVASGTNTIQGVITVVDFNEGTFSNNNNGNIGA